MIPDIRMTPSAISRIKTILSEGQYFKVGLIGGGCAGFEYQFEIVNKLDPDDLTVCDDGVTLVIDKKSYNKLGNFTLDWAGDLLGKKFIINTEKKSASCSCGKSFSFNENQ